MFERIRSLISGRGRAHARRSPEDVTRHVLDVLVVEGPDLGKRFTVDGDEVAIGRGTPSTGRPGDVLLEDATVSRLQAVLRLTGPKPSIEHAGGAKSPTLVNGKAVTRRDLEPGDRISVGRDVLTISEHEGSVLSTITVDLSRTRSQAATTVSGATTIPLRVGNMGTPVIHVEEGREFVPNDSFPLLAQGARVGRAPDSDIVLFDKAASRRHLEFIIEKGKVVLFHRSRTNPTLVNGTVLQQPGEKRELEDGDEIRVGEKIILRLRTMGAQLPGRESKSSLMTRVKDLIEEEERVQGMRQELAEKYMRSGTFVDLDVVDSSGMKGGDVSAELVVVSFERFRSFVERMILDGRGRVLNSNGDELMCYFERSLDAVVAGSAVLRGLEQFNAEENLLPTPFRLRIGVHTGTSLVDLERGKAYSSVLDTAGHLQKAAPTNGLLVSEETYDDLPEGLPFEQAQPLEKEKLDTFLLTGELFDSEP